eukprot:300455-Pelagomonas_calceolata.AAC.1
MTEDKLWSQPEAYEPTQHPVTLLLHFRKGCLHVVSPPDLRRGLAGLAAKLQSGQTGSTACCALS